MPKENKNKKTYSQKYTKIWETDPDLKDWLAADVTSETSATCKYCRVVLKAHKKDLVNHAKTGKHKKATAWEKSAKAFKPISEVYKPVLSESTKIAELKIAAFISEHCSLLTVDHLISILPQLDPSSDALKNLKIHRTKCSMLIKNVRSFG
ncbi:hypothetical protein ACJJTC_019417 [Scirpophaga incertulas]